MKTIVHIIGDANLSGAPLHVLQLAEGLASQFNFEIIGPPGPIADDAKAAGVTYHAVSMAGKFDFSAMRQITDKVSAIKERNHPVIIHTHGARAGLLGRLAVRYLGLPVVYTEHSWTNDYHLPNPLNEWFQIAGLRFLDRYTSVTVAVSKSVAAFLMNHKVAKEIVYIPHGIAVSSKVGRTKKPDDPLLIGSVGSLTWQKNYSWLLDLMPLIIARVPSVQLEIIGEGPERPKLESQIQQLGLSKKVTLIGSLSAEKLNLRRQEFTLYLQPSTTESFGLALAEAIAAGLPALGSNRGNIPELVGKEAVFDLSEQAAAANLIAGYLLDRQSREQLADKQRERLNQFSLPAMFQAYDQLYRRLDITG